MIIKKPKPVMSPIHKTSIDQYRLKKGGENHVFVFIEDLRKSLLFTFIFKELN